MGKWKTKNGIEIIRVLCGRSNVYLLTNGSNTILIDTSPENKWKELENRLSSLGITHIGLLILTHTHFDHAGNACRLKQKYNLKVLVQSEESQYLHKGENNFPEGTNIFTRTFMNLLGIKLSFRYNFEPCQSDIQVDSMYDLANFGVNAFIMHTPGHTKGSISVIVDNEIAIVGDAMFGVFKWSVYPPFADDSNMMINSWGKLLNTKCNLFLPAHGTANTRDLLQKCYKKELEVIKK